MVLHTVRAEPVEAQTEVVGIMSPSISSGKRELSRSVGGTTLGACSFDKLPLCFGRARIVTSHSSFASLKEPIQLCVILVETHGESSRQQALYTRQAKQA